MLSIIRELQIETTVRYHYTPIRMAKIQNTDNTSTGKDVECSFIASGMKNVTITGETDVSYKTVPYN